MAKAQEAFRGFRRNRRTAIRSYARARIVHRLELKREVKVMSAAEVIRGLAADVRQASSGFALIFFGIAIGLVLGLVLFDVTGKDANHLRFLAACSIIVTVVYNVGEKLGWMIDCLADFQEGK